MTVAKFIPFHPDRESANLCLLREGLFALSRYIIDADPTRLMKHVGSDVLRLTDYALSAEQLGVEPGKKVTAYGVLNLEGTTLAQWQAQMLATTMLCPQVRTPIVHIVISLREGEKFTEEGRDEAISIVLRTLGWERCPVLWGEHGNTSNPHIHLAIVRVDPLSGRQCGSQWVIEDLHQAIALIKEATGKTPEKKARYSAKDGAVYDRETGALVRDKAGTYPREWYRDKGVKNIGFSEAVRQAAPDLQNAIQSATTWSELHARLNALGARYFMKGSGALITVGGESVKASSISRGASFGRLCKRLGPFEASSPEFAVTQRTPDASRVTSESRSARSILKEWAKRLIAGISDSARNVLAPLIRSEAKAAAEAVAYSTKTGSLGARGRVSFNPFRDRPAAISANSTQIPITILPDPERSEEARSEPRFLLQPVPLEPWGRTHVDDGRPVFADFGQALLVDGAASRAVRAEAFKTAAERWKTGIVFCSKEQANLVKLEAEAAGLSISALQTTAPVTRSIEIASSSKHTVSSEPTPSASAPGILPDATDGAHDKARSHLAEVLEAIKATSVLVTKPDYERDPSGRLLLCRVALPGQGMARWSRIGGDEHQSLLRQKREATFDKIARTLWERCPEPEKLTPAKAQEHLRGDLADAARFALTDHDFLLLIERLKRSELEERKRAEKRKAERAAHVSNSSSQTVDPAVIQENLRRGRDL